MQLIELSFLLNCNILKIKKKGKNMVNYIIRRVLWAIPVLLVISLITFSLGHAIPGGPFDRENHYQRRLLPI